MDPYRIADALKTLKEISQETIREQEAQKKLGLNNDDWAKIKSIALRGDFFTPRPGFIKYSAVTEEPETPAPSFSAPPLYLTERVGRIEIPNIKLPLPSGFSANLLSHRGWSQSDVDYVINAIKRYYQFKIIKGELPPDFQPSSLEEENIFSEENPLYKKAFMDKTLEPDEVLNALGVSPVSVNDIKRYVREKQAEPIKEDLEQIYKQLQNIIKIYGSDITWEAGIVTRNQYESIKRSNATFKAELDSLRPKIEKTISQLEQKTYETEEQRKEIREYRKTVEALQTTVTKLEEQLSFIQSRERPEYIWVKILKPVSKFVSQDFKSRGPYIVGELANMPKTDADKLILANSASIDLKSEPAPSTKPTGNGKPPLSFDDEGVPITPPTQARIAPKPTPTNEPPKILYQKFMQEMYTRNYSEADVKLSQFAFAYRREKT